MGDKLSESFDLFGISYLSPQDMKVVFVIIEVLPNPYSSHNHHFIQLTFAFAST